MTRQEAFDKVARHLIAQGRKSFVVDVVSDKCLYRSSDGAKCAIGALLTEEDMTRVRHALGVDYNSKPVRSVVCHAPGTSLAGLDVDFLERLQLVHDGSAVPDWPLALRLFAERYGLKTDCIAESLAANPGFPR